MLSKSHDPNKVHTLFQNVDRIHSEIELEKS